MLEMEKLWNPTMYLLLGIHIDRELTLNDHVNYNYKKAGKKLNALMRVCNILPFRKRRLLMKAFVES